MIVRPFRLPVLLAMPLLAACQSLYFGVVNRGHDEYQAGSVVYAPDRRLSLDVYRPATTGAGTPVAVFFYGGSWRTGNRKQYAFVGRALAEKGILTLVVDYRTYPLVRFPEFQKDAASAVRWAIDHVAAYGGDPRRVFAVGHSAGAHVAALLATDAHYLAAEGLRPRSLAGVVGIAGPYDFLPLTDPQLIEVFGAESTWPSSQPVNFVDGDEPPFLLLQGEDDRVVWPRNSDRLAARLRTAGIAVSDTRYAGIGHFRILAGFRFPRLAPTLTDCAAFVLTSAATSANQNADP